MIRYLIIPDRQQGQFCYNEAMCSHYESVKDQNTLRSHFGADAIPEGSKSDMWPGYMGVFLRGQESFGAKNGCGRELLLGSFGLIQHWAPRHKDCPQYF